ncbi:reactive intermediate/imine deaminase [Adhaeribacter aerolatus]|uniref:Reactive intermediate/imine deaminase n=1 Tax=Adhaeribacter aerolatus TaxID=670289 RepID=A0A512AW38_9BACT|nr:Rid family detoxifying hydrolase [Adhaeribacter aerolatus]GEO03890.1 reactive intermediate/imine deaminase [Adhaeribacter aerolatus]
MKNSILFCVCLLFATSALAQQPASPKKNAKRIIKTAQAPQPIGPYSQGVVANGFLFVAGQVGANPQTRQLVTESFEAEATQVLENIKQILKAAGLDFQHVVKATIYVKDIGQFAKVNEIYGKYFISDPPARETVQVANLPGNANIEISVIAVME